MSPGTELGSDEEFEAELRGIEAAARSDEQRILTLLADMGVTQEQLDQLGWEYLDAGHSDMSPDGPYVAWIKERLARGPVMDDGGAAGGRVRARWKFADLSEEEQRRQLDRALAEMPELSEEALSEVLSAIPVEAKRGVEEGWDQYARGISSDPQFRSASDAERIRDAYGTGWMTRRTADPRLGV
jgi:hypothetical protein